MKVLIVFAHENPESFNGAMKNLAVQTLTAQGHEVQVTDLYAQGFNPVAGRHDFAGLSGAEYYKYQAEQGAAAKAGRFAPELQAEMDKLDRADFVLFQYPVWWFDTPAILKGWLDRVLAYGYAYGDGRMFDRGVFRGKRAMCAVTTGGPAAQYPDFSGTLMKPMQFGRLYFCGMDVLPPFGAFAPAHADDAGREAYLAEYRRRLEAIESTEPVRYPTMAEMGMG